MKSSYKNIISILLNSGLLIGLLSGCSNDNTNTFVAPELWSTFDSVKVKRDNDENVVYGKKDVGINISMMKNETESGQFIITAKSDIASFNIEKCDLKRIGGTEILSKDDIAVYAQKYIEIDNKYNLGNTTFVSGDSVPDMLLPIEKFVEYKENSIKKDKNQGITVDVKTTSETKAGKYYGNFTLTADGSTYSIPVNVEVWDIDKSGRNKVQSCFLVYKNYLLQGEYDTTDEMVDAYSDFLLDYNINSYVINSSANDENYRKEYIEYAKEHIDNESFNSIVIPVYFNSTYTYESGDVSDKSSRESAYQYIKGLIENSSEKEDLISLAYFYTTAFDEANAYAELYPLALEFYKKGGELDKTLHYYQSRLETDGVFDKLLEDGNSVEWVCKIKDFILNIPSVWPTTMYMDSMVDDMIVTNCPTLNQFDTGIYEQKLVDGASKSNNNLWTYTCSGPRNPYPTFHLDDYNLGTRVTGWMMKKYHINGYLYWAVNLYEPVSAFGSVDNYVNPYSTPDRAGKCPGDGFLLYPGNYYGHYGPYASLRLKSYRDAMDDYELLTIYENLLKEKCVKYGIEFDFDKYVSSLYDSLFSGTIYIKDDSLIVNARNELAKRILALQNEDELIFETHSDGEKYVSKIYSLSSAMNIGGEIVSGVKSNFGYYYDIETPVNTIETLEIKTNYTYKLNLPKSGLLVSPLSNIEATDDSKMEINDDYSSNVVITSLYKDDGKEIGGKTQRFMPGITLKKQKFTNISNIEFTVKNTTDFDVEFYVYLSSDATDNEVGSVALKPNQSRTININLLTLSEKFISAVNSWSIKMVNVTTDDDGQMVLFKQRSLSFSRIVYFGKGE